MHGIGITGDNRDTVELRDVGRTTGCDRVIRESSEYRERQGSLPTPPPPAATFGTVHIVRRNGNVVAKIHPLDDHRLGIFQMPFTQKIFPSLRKKLKERWAQVARERKGGKSGPEAMCPAVRMYVRTANRPLFEVTEESENRPDATPEWECRRPRAARRVYEAPLLAYRVFPRTRL